MMWNKVEDGLPTDSGKYLCVSYSPLSRNILTCYFAENLRALNKYDFEHCNYAGFYNYDSEYGYFRERYITHWMKLPDLPEV